MARTGQWQGEGAGNLNPAWSGRWQWRCARRLGAARRREDGCGVSGLCADPAAEVAGYGGGKEGKGSLWQLSSRVWGSGGAGRTSGCQKGLGSAGGRAGRQSLGGVGGGCLRSLSGFHGHRPLHGMGRPRAGCVLRQSCGRNEAGPYAVGHLGADQGAGACFLSSVAATTCRWLHRYSNHPPIPREGCSLYRISLFPSKGAGVGLDGGACAV